MRRDLLRGGVMLRWRDDLPKLARSAFAPKSWGILERLSASSAFNEAGCRVWARHINNLGYGRIRNNGRMEGAHRAAYEAFVGPVPKHLVIDHLCRNRACINPLHMEVVTHAVNIARGVSVSARYRVRTACVNGHEFTPENTRMKGSIRQCRACDREGARRRRIEHANANF